MHLSERSFSLDRFVKAQDEVYEQVLRELRAGRKETHWMWFVFPQIAGLGQSSMSRYYAISSLEEAKRYLQHPLLGRRLSECTEAVLCAKTDDPRDIFGSPDDRKFQSSLTLFLAADDMKAVLQEALDRFYGGKRDERTLALLYAGLNI